MADVRTENPAGRSTHHPRSRAKHLLFAGAFAALLVIVLSGGEARVARAASPTFGAVDLGTLGGTLSGASAISDNGQVVGYSQTGGGQYHAFSWTEAGGMVDLGTFGGSGSSAAAVSSGGQVVGQANTAGDAGSVAFSWTAAGGLVNLGTLGGTYSVAYAVNTAGQVVGFSGTNGSDGDAYHAFSWTQTGGLRDMGTLGGSKSQAVAVNDNGQAVGFSFTATGEHHAFSWTQAHGMVDLGTFGGTTSDAAAVNANGQVVGASWVTGDTSAHAFSWTASEGMKDLGTLGGSWSEARAVNDDGEVVGTSTTSGDATTHAFSWTASGGMVDLGTIGGTIATAAAINGGGQVIGDSSTTGDAAIHASSWTHGGVAVDLGTLGGSYSTARGVNSSGDVVGESDTAPTNTTASQRHATLWKPLNATAPGAPTGVAAAAGDHSAAVSWLAPASDGGSTITSYTVTASPGTLTATVAGSQTAATVSGLSNGTTYTFTVTATNVAGTSDPSAPSTAVTPQSGSTAAAGTAAPTSTTTVGTGSDPAATGGTSTSVTVPAGTSGGTVTVRQAAATEAAPSGFQFGGTQIDISAPTATADNPLTLVFTVTPPVGASLDDATLAGTDIYRAEGTGTPQPIPPCNTAVPVDPQPACVSNRQYVTIGGTSYVQVTVSAVNASHWNSARPSATGVTVSNSGYTPATATVQIGGRVNWVFTGGKAHSVTDAAGLGASGTALFDSGAKTSGGYGFAFPAAGAYSYKSSAKGDTMTGSVQVPVLVSHPGNSYVVIWAAGKLPGYVFDVQYRFKPVGQTKYGGWVTWRSGTPNPDATFDQTAAGTYSIHARMRNAATGKYSGDSPEATITIP